MSAAEQDVGPEPRSGLGELVALTRRGQFYEVVRAREVDSGEVDNAESHD